MWRILATTQSDSMTSDKLQAAKQVVRELTSQFDKARDDALAKVLQDRVASDYHWRGMHPFYEQSGAAAVVAEFWLPLRRALQSMQRREDIFFAGMAVHR